jgi:hypothetical protein
MADKLRPKQKKLWRRIYLDMFDGGANVVDAVIAADLAVRQWEERGAFDDETIVDPVDASATVEEKWNGVHTAYIHHSHVKMTAHAADGCFRVFHGDELWIGLDGLAKVEGSWESSENSIVFDAVVFGAPPAIGATARFVTPRVGIGHDAKVIR